jgi:hypothetical protein
MLKYSIKGTPVGHATRKPLTLSLLINSLKNKNVMRFHDVVCNHRQSVHFSLHCTAVLIPKDPKFWYTHYAVLEHKILFKELSFIN